MKPAAFLRELLYPLTDMAIILSMLFFGLLFAVARMSVIMSGFVGTLLALFLLAIVVPPFFRYLLFLLEARANGKEAPALDAELFGMANKLWALTPMVLIALLIWGGIMISGYGYLWSVLYGTVILIIFPASIAILAITHSPVESLNPTAIWRMILACGPSYFLIPTTVVATHLVFNWLGSIGLWTPLDYLATSYQAVLLFTLTGGVLDAKGVTFDLKIDQPLEPTEEEIAGDLEKEREKVASHAYGFISRGNRAGGFAHIMDWIQKEPDVHEASAWFFNTMMQWESKDPALFYAQTYISHLLHHDEDLKALKLISVCLHANPRWKPKAEDREHVLELVKKYQRDDLLASLRN
jgi:hypothetical protein